MSMLQSRMENLRVDAAARHSRRSDQPVFVILNSIIIQFIYCHNIQSNDRVKIVVVSHPSEEIHQYVSLCKCVSSA